jgi:hypothetical protein
VIARAGPAAAQDVPSNLQIVGTISGSSDVSPEQGDRVLVVNSGKTAASGSVQDGQGTYFVEMSKSQSFNGTTLTLRLRKSSGTYQLEFGPDNQFTFSGGFPFPQRQTINPTIGAKVGGGSGGGGGDGGSGGGGQDGFSGDDVAQFDVNGDGVFNQDDIDLIKDAIVEGENPGAADVDGNGIVNTRDAISAIRAFTDRRRARAPQGGRDGSNDQETDQGAPDEGASNTSGSTGGAAGESGSGSASDGTSTDDGGSTNTAQNTN